MAHRPVFGIAEKPPFYFEESTEFVFNAGFSLSQKQKNIRALHDSYSSAHKDARILEISSKSENIIGVQLSAFNLPVVVGDAHTTVEAAFQSGKKFAYGGPYPDMLFSSSRTAKKDPRLKESGPLIGFELNGQQFPLEPKTFFMTGFISTQSMQILLFRNRYVATMLLRISSLIRKSLSTVRPALRQFMSRFSVQDC